MVADSLPRVFADVKAHACGVARVPVRNIVFYPSKVNRSGFSSHNIFFDELDKAKRSFDPLHAVFGVVVGGAASQPRNLEERFSAVNEASIDQWPFQHDLQIKCIWGWPWIVAARRFFGSEPAEEPWWPVRIYDRGE